MLDIKAIREQLDHFKTGAAAKRLKVDFERLLALDSEIREVKTELERCLALRNKLSKDIGAAAPDKREGMKKEVQDLKAKIDAFESDLAPKKTEFDELMLLVPQPARADVPHGKDDSENVEVKKVGTVPTFSFKIKDHITLGAELDILDFERGVKLSGSRSYILKGAGARLEQAVLRFTFDMLCNKGFTPLSIPVLVREEAMIGTGYFPTGREQAYYVEKDALALVGTGEVSLTSFRSNEILNANELPIKVMAQSGCFRREAGTYGKDTSGLYRVHQFQKIEQVVIGENDVAQSEKYHDEILNNAELVLQALELPYRVVYVCTGDLGQGQVRKHDIETWMPSRNNYAETHSCSTFHEFQARRLKLRYKNKDGETVFCHTLNNTAIASPRVLIPLLECHQQADGSVRIPKALQPYMGGMTEIKKGSVT